MQYTNTYRPACPICGATLTYIAFPSSYNMECHGYSWCPWCRESHVVKYNSHKEFEKASIPTLGRDKKWHWPNGDTMSDELFCDGVAASRCGTEQTKRRLRERFEREVVAQ